MYNGLMAKQNTNSKFHEKLKKLLETIKGCIDPNANDGDTSILIKQFMDEQFQLCHDYFQYHLDEAKAIALEYQTHLAYAIDLINLNGYYTNNTYCDDYYLHYDACSNIEAFNLMFGFIGHIKMDNILKDLGDDWSPIFQVQQANAAASNEIIAKDSDPVFTEKLINLLDSIKTWSINVCERNLEEKTEKFMDDLWSLYLDYFQYHLEEVRIALVNHQKLLSKNIEILNDMYVDSQFDYVERTTSNEYLDPPWVEACKIRSRIEAFNDMFGFLGTLNNEGFACWLVEYQGEASFVDEICDAPKKHWWWTNIKRAQDDFIRALWEDNHSTEGENNSSIENNGEIIFLDQFRKKH